MTWQTKLTYGGPVVDATDTLTDAELTALFAAVEAGDAGTADVLMDAAEHKLAGQEATPKDAAAAGKLKVYWVSGPGGKKIRWGTKGDFDRCVALVSKHMAPEKAKGYCNLRHKDALGFYPATHAAMAGKDLELPPPASWRDVVVEVKLREADGSGSRAVPPKKGGIGAAVAKAGAAKAKAKRPPGNGLGAQAGSQSRNEDFESKHPRKGGKFAKKGTKDDDGKGVNNQGLSDEQVKALQQKLIALGYKISVDGKIGPETRAALRRFQSDHGLSASGSADSTSRNLLAPLSAGGGGTGKKKTGGRSSGGGGGSSGGSGAAKTPAGAHNGSGHPVKVTRSQVMKVQKLLQAHSGGGLVKQDGIIGPKTTAAIKLYQKKIGLQPTGVLDQPTYSRLTSKSPVPKARAVPGRKALDMAATGSLEELGDTVAALLSQAYDDPEIEILATYPDRVYFVGADSALRVVSYGSEGDGDDAELRLTGDPAEPSDDDTVAAELATAIGDDTDDGEGDGDDGDDAGEQTAEDDDDQGDDADDDADGSLEGKGLDAELPGTLEAVLCDVKKAARARFSSPDPTGNPTYWVRVVGTYTDKIVVALEPYRTVELGGETRYYSVPYSWEAGEVTLGEAMEVEVTAGLKPVGSDSEDAPAADQVIAMSAKVEDPADARTAAALLLRRLAVDSDA